MSTFNQLIDVLGKISDRSPALDAEFCINQRHLRAGQCEVCANVCPVDAITFAPVPQIDPGTCLGCGACVAVCPAEALSSRRTVIDIWEDVRQIADQTGTASFVCRAVPGEHFEAARIPCIGAIPFEVYVALASAGIEDAVIYTADCAQCPLADGPAQAERALADAAPLIDVLGRSLSISTREGRPPQAKSDEAGLSRRAFLTTFLKRPAEEPAEVSLDDFLDVGINPRRAIFLEALSRTAIPDAVQLNTSANHWGMLEVSEACVGCPMCAQLCPTTALEMTSADGVNALWFDPARCTACGLCVRACFKDALSWKDVVPLAEVADDHFVLIWEGTPPENPLRK